jgi:hypothetical protein
MAKQQRNDSDLRRYAVIGAEQRLLQIAEEAANIFQTFPELRERGFMAEGERPDAPAAGARQAAKGGGKRQGISAAGRKRIADAQRARWAKQRAAKKTA